MSQSMCSVSETSSTGGGLYYNGTESLAAGTAAQAQYRATTQTAARLTRKPAAALLQQHPTAVTATGATSTTPAMGDALAYAQRQAAQLAALLSTQSGKPLMQQLAALQQQQHHHHQQQQGTSTSHISVDNACAAAVAEQVDETTCSFSDLHTRVLSTAIAVSRTAPGSADRASGLELLTQELMQHAPLSTALALAAAGSGNSKMIEAAAAAAALNKAQATDEPQQQHQLRAKAPPSPTNSSHGEPLTCAAAWLMLQKQRQQQQQLQSQDSGFAGASSPGLLRNDTLQSTQSMSMHQDSVVDASLSGQISQGVSRGGSQQMVFKRRSTNSTALRRHFGIANKPSRCEPAGLNRPQQVFKKQRKKPLMLWSNSSNLQQQYSSLKQQQQQGVLPAYSQPAEPEYSTVAASSSGATAPALPGLLDAHLPVANTAAAGLGAHKSGVDNVLSTLARQEQQLLLLQQQLRQQRELISLCQQAKQASALNSAENTGASAAAAEAVRALELELLLSNQLVPAAAVPQFERVQAADVDMSEVHQCLVPTALQPQQHEEPESTGLNTAAISTLMLLAKALVSKQLQQQQSAGPAAPGFAPAAAPAAASDAQGWDPDVVRKLTAALLAA